MKPEIENIQQFVKSLGPGQRRFFIRREAEVQTRLQSSLRDFGRGVSELSALNGETLAVVLGQADCLQPAAHSKE